jgi:hypothetical protein
MKCDLADCPFPHHVAVWLLDGSASVFHGSPDSDWTGWMKVLRKPHTEELLRRAAERAMPPFN